MDFKNNFQNLDQPSHQPLFQTASLWSDSILYWPTVEKKTAVACRYEETPGMEALSEYLNRAVVHVFGGVHKNGKPPHGLCHF